MRHALTIFGLSLALPLAGCGGSPVTLTIGSQSLTIQDQGYFTTNGVDYCMAGAPKQMLLKFVDYNYICDPKNQPERDPGVAHLELDIILSMNNPLRDPRQPYVVGHADCVNGPTAEAIAELVHYAPNGKSPDTTTQADSGSVTFTSYPTDRTLPWVGTYDLTFGSSHVKQPFTIYACN
jgi:hypothetical protein